MCTSHNRSPTRSLTHNPVEKMSDWPLDLDGLNPVPVPEITAKNDSELYRVVRKYLDMFAHALIQLLCLCRCLDRYSQILLNPFSCVCSVSMLATYKPDPTCSSKTRKSKNLNTNHNTNDIFQISDQNDEPESAAAAVIEEGSHAPPDDHLWRDSHYPSETKSKARYCLS